MEHEFKYVPERGRPLSNRSAELVVRGQYHKFMLIPPMEHHTRWFDAGPVSIGVESRALGNEDHMIRGPSIHVFDSEHDKEFVRFDIFGDVLHYHFVLADDIGYIRCTQFGEQTSTEMRAALDDLQGQGIKGLILDLRNNPGGLLEAAKDVSDLFLDAGQIIVSTRGRDGRRLQEIYATTDDRYAKNYPLVVMINENSASASEIVAGAIQDWDRGLVVGQNSFGKGSVQSIFQISDDEALKLTTAKYYTPSGRCIHKDENNHRITPEEMLQHAQAAEAEDGDDSTQLQQAPEIPIDQSDLPLYSTLKLQRPVRGGGGIMPDIVLAPDEISDAALDLERRSAFFNFAVELLADHPVTIDFKVDAALMQRFHDWLKDNGIELEDQAFTDNEDYIRMALRREVLYKQFGNVEAYRSTLGMDRVLQETLNLLKGQRDLDALLARSGEDDSATSKTQQ